MSVIVNTYSSPVFVDKKIQTLNEKLDVLGWIDKQFPLAWMGEDKTGTYPEVYYNDGSNKNYRVMPEGGSISFFQIEGEITQVEEYHFTCPLSLTVWADLRKVYPTKKYDYTLELVKEVSGTLRDNSCNDLSINLNQTMDEFTALQKVIHQNTMRPYSAFKISFTVLITLC